MTQAFLYALLALLATTIGALTGMGGGIIIKPMLDITGQFDAPTINMLSSVTVLAMAIVSVVKQIRNGAKMRYSTALPLAVGTVAGGWLGGTAIQAMIQGSTGNLSFVVQNAVLALLIVCAFFYMQKKQSLPSFQLAGMMPSALVGLLLGSISAFLGIGGGPINVALIMLLFSYSAKQAALSSLVIILFSQITKVGGILLAGNLAQYDAAVLLPMVVGAIAGGLAGSQLQAHLSDKLVERTFNAVQVGIFGICVANILRYL